jgi:DNA-binding response OmpR family regulator
MPGQRKKILWVDDEIEYLRSHIMFLETRGYSVIPVFSGDDAIQMIQQNPREFDIVLLDEQMPGKDGLTTLEEIKDLDASSPVVMVTKSEEEQLMEDALGKKIDGYLTKPVNPSQILLVCKRILDAKQIISSKVKQKFVRNYSNIRTAISNRITTQDWIKLHENLTSWDLEIEKLEDEGVRQAHAGQKSDCNKLFSDYAAENYARWIKGEGDMPVLSHSVVDKYLYPLLQNGKKVFFIVLSGLRLDQYMEFERILSTKGVVKRYYHFSVLPTVSSFSRNALFSGMLPITIAQEKPDLWSNGRESAEESTRYEKELFHTKLRSLGVDPGDDDCWFQRVSPHTDGAAPLIPVESTCASPLKVVAVDFCDLVLQNQRSSSLIKEIVRDENGFRELAIAWFQRSELFGVIRDAMEKKWTVVVTSDHGMTLCTRGTELYSAPDFNAEVRYVFGERISSDERRVVYLGDPGHFGLPSLKGGSSCIIAKENYHFVQPEKFENYAKFYKASFQQGGISMDEIIMPFGVFEKK